MATGETLTDMFVRRAGASGDSVMGFSKVSDRWRPFTWAEARLRVEECASGLLALGVRRGDRIAIISNTCREWSEADMAILFVGGVTVGVDPALEQGSCRRLLAHSGARLAFVEDAEQREKILQEMAGTAMKVITFEDRVAGNDAMTLVELRGLGSARLRSRPDELSRHRKKNKAADVATYVYGHGPTEAPKAAMLTHENISYVVSATHAVMPQDGEVPLLFLPHAHALQRSSCYAGLVADAPTYYAESLSKVRDNLAEVRPTCFVASPALLENIRAEAMRQGEALGGLRSEVFRRSVDTLEAVGDAKRRGRRVGVRKTIAARVACRLVADKIRAVLGGRVRWLGAGGDALAPELCAFFENVKIPILEGWGLTETSGSATINTLANRRVGSVGRPIPGTQVRIAEDGEILVRGPGVFQGYYRDEAATRAAFTEDGWLKSGRSGRMSRDGFLELAARVQAPATAQPTASEDDRDVAA